MREGKGGASSLVLLLLFFRWSYSALLHLAFGKPHPLCLGLDAVSSFYSIYRYGSTLIIGCELSGGDVVTVELTSTIVSCPLPHLTHGYILFVNVHSYVGLHCYINW